MLRWGDAIYAPVYEGMRFGIDVYNGRDCMVAVPTFIENANLWAGGPTTPEACAPSHMWELRPGQEFRMDALMNPAGQVGRPIVITQAGFGATVGEATFGTTQYRGQLRIYERMPIVPPPVVAAGPAEDNDDLCVAFSAEEAPIPRAMAAPASSMSARPAAPAPSGGAPPPPAMARSRAVTGAPAPKAAEKSASRGQAGFGAGQEEERRHHFTGVDYHPAAALLLSLRIEFREDLEEIVKAALGGSWNWRWPADWGGNWYERPWMWPVPPTAPHIPVTTPGQTRG